MECIPGCHDCCGPVYFSRLELKRAPLLAKNIEALSELVEMKLGIDWHFNCATCIYVQADGRCGIYKDRPFVCRIFGMTEEPMLKCPHGRGPAKPMSLAETHELVREYRAIREANAREGW
jgi:Fe-S-cluster containining protein